jgi:hypothetical protein
LSVELGALFMGRVQGTPLYAGVGPVIWASLNYSDWLFGLSARFDAFQTQPTGHLPGFEMMGFGAGLELARRFEVGSIVGLDTGLGVQVLQELQSYGDSEADQQGASTGGEVAGESTDIRLLAIARLHVGGRGVRFTADLEAELSPLRVGRDRRIDETLPTLPSFGLGAGAGVSWQGP